MSYDPDLSPIIAKASNEDLDPLVQYMLKANTNFLEISDNYKLHEPDHSKYKDLIEKEMRLFGGNSFVNLFRETGPSYLEIAGDVADKLDAS
jgi:hypothetical protein